MVLPTVLETAYLGYKASVLPLKLQELYIGLDGRIRTYTFLAPNEVDFLLSQSEIKMVDSMTNYGQCPQPGLLAVAIIATSSP